MYTLTLSADLEGKKVHLSTSFATRPSLNCIVKRGTELFEREVGAPYKFHAHRTYLYDTHLKAWAPLRSAKYIENKSAIFITQAKRGMGAFARCFTPQLVEPKPPGPETQRRKELRCGKLVDVTKKVGKMVQGMINRTYDLSFKETRPGASAGLQVVRVVRVEHTRLWRAYRFHQTQLEEKIATSTVARVDRITSAAAFPDGCLKEPLNVMLNEAHLFHGTKKSIADIICKQGMDERVTRSGRHGAGLYFAENASKSDQYMEEAEDGFCDLFICRVLLGKPFVRKLEPQPQRELYRRPPCVEGHVDCTEGHVMMDSVLAEIPQTAREFVVFDRSKVYPEFLVRVRRVSQENPEPAY